MQTMRVIDKLCELEGENTIVAVFSDAGIAKGEPNTAISDLLQGNPRGVADRWLKSKRGGGYAVIKSEHPVPVDADYNVIDDQIIGYQNPPEGTPPPPKVVGYVSMIHFVRK